MKTTILLAAQLASLLVAANGVCAEIETVRQVDAMSLEEIGTCSLALTGWIERAGLGDKLQVLQVRRARHPDPAVGASTLRLELRWMTEAETWEAAQGEYGAFSDSFVKSNGDAPTERLFYKLVQTCKVPTAQASAHVHVLDIEYYSYLNASGSLFSGSSNRRMTVAKAAVPAPAPSANVPVPALTRCAKTRVNGGNVPLLRVQEVIKRYFEPRGTFSALEMDGFSLHFKVRGLRGEVLHDHRYWENLEAVLFITSDNGQKLLQLNLDGGFAAGGGNTPPAATEFVNMEQAHSKELQDYASKFLLDLTPKLEEGMK